MEVRVDAVSGAPAGSVLSVRAGQARRQGPLAANKAMHFAEGILDANPCTVDVFAPLASTRLTLVPGREQYQMELPQPHGEAMRLLLSVKEADKPPAQPARTQSRQNQRSEKMEQCQAYVEKHNLAKFMQNLMQSVLADQPDDPFEYMEKCFQNTRVTTQPAPTPGPPTARKTRAAAAAAAPAKVDDKQAMFPTAKDFQPPAFVVEGPGGSKETVRPLVERDVLPAGGSIRRLKVENLGDTFPTRQVQTPLRELTSHYVDQDAWVTEVILRQNQAKTFFSSLSAGPREKLHFQPSEVVATIVTCGGLCPGLNSVVRQVVQMLNMYGVKKVYGIPFGYKGVTEPHNWVELTPKVVQDIHDLGGTVLASDRGNPPVEEQAEALRHMGVRAHFVIGGDGTHRGAHATYEAMKKVGWECAVVGVPKTIDNDVPMLDRTFGFDTACTEAAKAVHAAYTEATCNANCIGLVKLMGRHSGFIAMHACLAARFVDMCLLPEMDIELEKVLDHCLHLLQTKGHAVIVVAEGCGDTLVKSSGECDAGGNVKLADVGPWLKDKILDRFKAVKLPLTIKYIDPTYMIRAVRPNANDSVYCAVLAENAVHAAMAGYTGVTIGQVSGRVVVLPIQAITGQKARKVDLGGRWFNRLMACTRQPLLGPEVPPAETTEPTLEAALLDCSEPVHLGSLVAPSDEVKRMELEHLRDKFGAKEVATTLDASVQGAELGFFDAEAWATTTLGKTRTGVRAEHRGVSLQLLRAGPRKTLHWKPENVAAAIVTCGGLCPGLNSVIREIVMMLYAYGVKKVYGIKGGFKGTVNPQMWMTLTPENVKDIHMQGGTVLVSDRGNPPEEEAAKVLRSKGVRQYFVIGGDGTHRGADATFQAMKKLDWECSVVGVPKTIDNDIALLDRTFGFDSACSEALQAIRVAYVEATCNANCIGLVKLMGRHRGYLAMTAVMAARYADICLLPEMDVSTDKVLEQCASLVKSKGYAVVVVAEGCGDTLIQSSGEADAGGNKKLADAGLWLKDTILAHFKAISLPLTIKYVDPTYMVRAIPANANDSVYCSLLAHAAVHGAMAGYTGVTVGKIDETFVYLPIRAITGTPNRKVDPEGPQFERMLATTLQPNLGMEGSMKAKPSVPGTPNTWKRASLRGGRGLLNEDAEVRIQDTKFTVVDGFGATQDTRPLAKSDLLSDGAAIRKLACFNLSERFGVFDLPTTLNDKKTVMQDKHSWTTQSFMAGPSGENTTYYQLIRAGPREKLHFDPHDPASCAAIVSCGGICPGLNSVIREIVMTLWDYGVRRIWGIKGGYKGVVEPESWVQLTPDVVMDIHAQGGTMLVSDRGNPPIADMARVLKEQGVRQYFVLGGDGTHKGAMQSFDACLEIDHECAVMGVPKTIDNDVPMLDQTFGFDTATTEAVKAVDSAYVEATCNANCIGLVKLMGRHCGFIAMDAVLSARHADICLLPEMDIDAEKVLAHVEHLMRTKKHAVIVVAEGCGDTLIKSSGETDAGGNKVLADAGLWLKNAITQRFKTLGLPLTIKYIDPTYMIRSVPANAFDSQYCSALAQNAVHGAMAGFSGVTVGKVHERYVYLPIHAITQQKGRRVNVQGRWFMRLLETTKQPDFTPDHVGEMISARTDGAIDPDGVLRALSDTSNINEVLEPGDEVKKLDLVHLGAVFPSKSLPNKSHGTDGRAFVDDNAWATTTLQRFNKRDDRGHTYYQMLLGGPRASLHFDAADSSAVIVTCGGLCPGLNTVIREVTMTLMRYGVTRIYGCRGGYKGMVQPQNWMELTPEVVKNIHMQGGTILVSDRGNPPHSEIAKTLQEQGVRQCFIIGGDGTHRGAMDMFQCTQQIGHECSVVGIPKTIDNDIPILDRSFGFKTACTEAVKAIDSAYTEATSNANCIGLVKLMGRHCGWIAMEAVLAARHVDVCLIPEMNVSLPKLLTHLRNIVKTQGFAVVVVAEGCGDTLIQSSGERDAGGNKKLADVGPWLTDQLVAHFKKMQEPLTVKFIDPTYTIRAVPANANDSVYCSVLAQHAVHGAMAGYSGITVGKVDGRYVMLPIHAITDMVGARKVSLTSRQFERLMQTTGQPGLKPGPGDDWALMPPAPPPRPAEPPAEKPAEIDIFAWKAPPTDAGCSEPGAANLRMLDGYGGEVVEERKLESADIVAPGAEVRSLPVMKLGDRYSNRAVRSPLADEVKYLDNDSWAVESFATADRVESASIGGQVYYQMLRAGPREFLHFDPRDAGSCAAIMTCGGICPGENDAIRCVAKTLHRYGVSRVYGIVGGFMGILDRASWMELTPEGVQNIHQKGGTILKSSRGNPPAVQAAAALKEHGVRQLFALGGDGTLRGVLQIMTALSEVDHECACLAIPSTINNDIPLAHRTFGFDTACTVARDSIDAAYVEATCNANCIGLVKLTGSEAGFMSMTAVLAARHVDVCLIPEMEISLEKVLQHCEHLMATQQYAVVVVTEGCKDSLLRNFDGAAGDVGDIGIWFRDQILARFKQNSKPLTIKYIDPTYTVRSAKANAHDRIMCAAQAEHAVHGAMAGLTCCGVATVHGRMVYLPLQAITHSPSKRVNPRGNWFARALFTTKQPHFEPDGFEYASKGSGASKLKDISFPVGLGEVVLSGTEVRRLNCTNLSATFTSSEKANPLQETILGRGGAAAWVQAGSWSMQTLQRVSRQEVTGRSLLQLLRCGPRRSLHFDPTEPGAAAAIVTCGGLCPGLNSVIRELSSMLRSYGVQTVYGIKGGYNGCTKDDEWIDLSQDTVQNIHMLGGSILVSDRGNPPHSEIAAVMQKRKVRQFFVLGGDGTHKGALSCFNEMTKINHECAVVGVPKTIDNDIQVLDRSFGFDTACTEAMKAIDSAYVEATTNANCIGLVKLMGRHCGWIAAHAALAARNVDVCLLPEMNISLPKLLDHIASLMRQKRHAVVVVAEGCGDTIIEGSGECDAGGNKKLADVGPYLKDEITRHCKAAGIPLTIKYIDPTYMIRSVRANAYDSTYCSVLAQEAVHAAMAGYTGITVGKVDERYVMLPIHAITEQGPRKLDLQGRVFERLMAATLQPDLSP